MGQVKHTGKSDMERGPQCANAMSPELLFTNGASAHDRRRRMIASRADRNVDVVGRGHWLAVGRRSAVGDAPISLSP